MNISILIVDDNISQCKTLSMILSFKGYEVVMAYSGMEAVAAVRQRPFDVILMDIKMPQMNGVDAYRQIKAMRPDTVAIMMTAYAVVELEAEALSLGVRRISYKPLDIDCLLSQIEKIN